MVCRRLAFSSAVHVGENSVLRVKVLPVFVSFPLLSIFSNHSDRSVSFLDRPDFLSPIWLSTGASSHCWPFVCWTCQHLCTPSNREVKCEFLSFFLKNIQRRIRFLIWIYEWQYFIVGCFSFKGLACEGCHGVVAGKNCECLTHLKMTAPTLVLQTIAFISLQNSMKGSVNRQKAAWKTECRSCWKKSASWRIWWNTSTVHRRWSRRATNWSVSSWSIFGTVFSCTWTEHLSCESKKIHHELWNFFF